MNLNRTVLRDSNKLKRKLRTEDFKIFTRDDIINISSDPVVEIYNGIIGCTQVYVLPTGPRPYL